MNTKTAIVKQLHGITVIGKSDSNHWVVMDGSEKFGGSNAGSTPKELLLMALGGCTAFDVISILSKKRIPIQRLEVHLTGNERDEHPKIFTSIHLDYIVYGENIDPSAIERAIDLSTSSYCSVSAMLKATVKLTHSFKIEVERELPAN